MTIEGLNPPPPPFPPLFFLVLQGRGCYTFADGRRYEGEYQTNHKHGRGVYKWANGLLFTGSWIRGAPVAGFFLFPGGECVKTRYSFYLLFWYKSTNTDAEGAAAAPPRPPPTHAPISRCFCCRRRRRRGSMRERPSSGAIDRARVWGGGGSRARMEGCRQKMALEP